MSRKGVYLVEDCSRSTFVTNAEYLTRFVNFSLSDLILDESNRLSEVTAYSMVILCHIDQVKPRQSRQEHKSRI